MSGYVVIPTRFDRATLKPLIDVCQAVATVVIVHTVPGHPEPAGTVTVRSDARNIHTWWNLALNICAGPTLVLNDDVTADPKSLTTMLQALDTADLVYLTGRQGTTPLTGWCFGLRPDRIRPDESFTWWFGDDDLWQRAHAKHLTIRELDLPIRHVRTGPTFPDPAMQEAATWDQALYLRRWSSAPTRTAPPGSKTA